MLSRRMFFFVWLKKGAEAALDSKMKIKLVLFLLKDIFVVVTNICSHLTVNRTQTHVFAADTDFVTTWIKDEKLK